MNVTYEHKKELTFIGFHTEIAPVEGYKKCPEFWDKDYNEKYARLGQTMKPETPTAVSMRIIANTAAYDYSTLDLDLDCDHRDSKDHGHSDCK